MYPSLLSLQLGKSKLQGGLEKDMPLLLTLSVCLTLIVTQKEPLHPGTHHKQLTLTKSKEPNKKHSDF
jgi:hypothetical protein